MRTIRLLLILTTALCACSTPHPDREIRNVGDEFLKAYNSGSFEALTAFFTRHAEAGRQDEAPGRAQWVRSFVWQPIRTLRVSSHAQPSPSEITYLGNSVVTDAWYRFSLEIDADTGGVSFGFESAAPPSTPQPRLTAAEAALQIHRYVDRVCEAGVFSGAILVARDGAPVVTRACTSDLHVVIRHELQSRMIPSHE
ncbi:MAG TPA: hypothetical protein VMT00_07245 [Thermoanaerobaculia bacterium]|nr:hypothetical protein [Thermoanaerobaculia bacterium]